MYTPHTSFIDVSYVVRTDVFFVWFAGDDAYDWMSFTANCTGDFRRKRKRFCSRWRPRLQVVGFADSEIVPYDPSTYNSYRGWQISTIGTSRIIHARHWRHNSRRFNDSFLLLVEIHIFARLHCDEFVIYPMGLIVFSTNIGKNRFNAYWYSWWNGIPSLLKIIGGNCQWRI